jgi:hypothetical protein
MDEAVKNLVSARGGTFKYVSARDGKTYLACLAFEGDDTLGCIGERGLQAPLETFFTDYGWKAKLRWPKNMTDYIRFVGYDVLLHDNLVVEMAKDDIVMFPEIKRALKTKCWSTCVTLTPDQTKTIDYIYACTMAAEYRHYPPMHNFYRCLANDNTLSSDRRTKSLNSGNAEQQHFAWEEVFNRYVAVTGEKRDRYTTLRWLSDLECCSAVDGGDDFEALAYASAGRADNEEISNLMSITTVNRPGSDLADFLPRSWVS